MQKMLEELEKRRKGARAGLFDAFPSPELAHEVHIGSRPRPLK